MSSTSDLIADIRDYLKDVNEHTSWFCVVDDIESICDSYEPRVVAEKETTP